MVTVNWQAEPDVEALRSSLALLKSDPDRAIAQMQQLAAKKSLASMWFIADFYQKSTTVGQDLEKARYWYRQAASLGDDRALHMVGRISSEMHDITAATVAFTEAAGAGYMPSMYRLGLLYQEGVGVPRDMDRARKIFEAASLRGHFLSKRALAIMYLRGTFGAGKVFRGAHLLISLAGDLILIKSKNRDELEDRIVT